MVSPRAVIIVLYAHAPLGLAQREMQVPSWLGVRQPKALLAEVVTPSPCTGL